MTRKIDIEALCADKGLRITEQRKIPHLITLGGGDPITGANKTAYAWRTTIRLDMENRTQVMCTQTGELSAAAEAFRDGRKPEWKPL